MSGVKELGLRRVVAFTSIGDAVAKWGEWQSRGSVVSFPWADVLCGLELRTELRTQATYLTKIII